MIDMKFNKLTRIETDLSIHIFVRLMMGGIGTIRLNCEIFIRLKYKIYYFNMLTGAKTVPNILIFVRLIYRVIRMVRTYLWDN